jgi:predicted ATPase/DNA-binding SARP family transcriptional activator
MPALGPASLLRLRNLGPLRIGDAVGDRSVGGTKLARILSMLLVNANQRVTVDALVDCVWPVGGSSATAGTLESHIWRVRRMLEPHRPRRQPSTYLINEAAGYRLVVNPDSVDSLRFAELAEQGEELLRGGDAARARARCEAALALWRGRPFEDVADEDWAAPSVARLEDLRAQVRERHVEALLMGGEHRKALAETEELVAEAPYREAVWAQRMLALYRDGRAEEALRAFQTARDQLLEHAGLEPGPALMSMQHRILVQDPALELTGSASRPAEPTRTAVSLPMRLSPLIGRGPDVERLAQLVAQHRLITVIGPAGCGKTRLSIEVARAARGVAPDGVWFLDLSAIDSPTLLVDSIVSTLGIAAPAVGPPVDALRAFVRDRRLLLVLDNCEHLLTAVAELSEILLSDEPDCRILATSREPLSLDGEILWPLSPLPTADANSGDRSGDAAEPSLAAQLFIARAGAADPRFVLDADTLGRVESICSAVDGLPLAIELAAGRIRVATLAEIVDETHRDPLTLRRLGRVSAGHHQTLEAALEWSHRLLPEPAQAVYRRLSVLPGAFTPAAAIAVAGRRPLEPGQVPQLLDVLLHRSLLAVVGPESGGRSRHVQLATVRAHAGSLLAAVGEQARTVAARGEWVHALIADRPTTLANDTHGWYQTLDDNLDVVRAVLQEQLLDSPDGRGVWLTARLTPYWYRRARLVEGEHWTRLALEVADADPADRIATQLGLAYVLTLRDRDDLAEPLVREALAQREQLPRPQLAENLFNLAWGAWVRGSARFEHLAAEYVAMARASGRPEPQLLARLLEARAAVPGGDLSLARRRTAAVYDEAIAQGNAVAAWLASLVSTVCALVLRDPASGALWLPRVAHGIEQLGGSHVANLLEYHGDFAAMRGRYVDAARFFAAARAAARRAGAPWPNTAMSAALIDETRRTLSADDYDGAWRDGQAMAALSPGELLRATQ